MRQMGIRVVRDLPGQDHGAEAASSGRILGRVWGINGRLAMEESGSGNGAFAAPPQPAQCLTCLACHGFGRDWRAQVSTGKFLAFWSRQCRFFMVCGGGQDSWVGGSDSVAQCRPPRDVTAVASMQSRAATCLFGGEVFLDVWWWVSA